MVDDCTLLFPSYFSSPNLTNALWGEVEYTNANAGTVASMEAVHLEADGSLVGNRSSFYNGFAGSEGADGREGLGSRLGGNFLGGTISTSFIVWRDAPDATNTGFTCGDPPPWTLDNFPVLFFDEEENPAQAMVSLSAISQVWDVSNDAGNPYDSGWALTEFPHDAWIGVLYESGGGFRSAMPGIEVPLLPFFADGFESGDLSGWSSSMP